MRRLKTTHQGTVAEDETPRLEGAGSASGRKQKENTDTTLLKETTEFMLREGSGANVQSRKRKIRSCEQHTIGTWKVSHMDEKKLETIKQVMKRIGLALLGVSDLNWIGRGCFRSDDYVVLYSGNDQFSRNGVAFLVRQDVAQAIGRCNPKSDRVISVRLEGQPASITVVQVDAPGPNDATEEVERFYASVQEEVDLTPEHDVLLIIGDWNATVGDKPVPNIVGPFGLGVRNEAGERLIGFCGANHLFIANTCFMLPKRRLYTWASLKDHFRHQTDYIIGRNRWRRYIQSAKPRQDVDCGTGHKLLIATIKVTQKVNYKTSVVEQYNTSERSEDYVKNRSVLTNSVSHKQEELGAPAGEIKDMGNIAASFLTNEKITTPSKFRSNAAENGYYEFMLREGSVVNVQSRKREIRSCEQHTIGTWKVSRMDEKKLETIKQVMKRIGLVLLGVSDLNWIGRGCFRSDDYVMLYSGNDQFSRNGVAFIVRQDVAQAIGRYNPKSDRVISVRLEGQPASITVVQVDAPGPNDATEEVERFYASVQEEVDLTPEHDVLLIIGDWNATVGDKPESNIVGPFGLGVRNEAGERLIGFCGANHLFIANTCFMLPKRRLYTWASPKDQFRRQIDYIIGKTKWRSSIQSAKTRPGVDCGTDHKLLIATIKVTQKVNYKTSVVEQYNTSERSEDYVKNRSVLTNSVSHKQEELGAPAGEIKDMGNIAASFLVHEKIWFDKFRYDAAEKRFYEQMSDGLHTPSGQQSASCHSFAGPAGDWSKLAGSLEVENQDLRRASSRLENHPSVLEKGST